MFNLNTSRLLNRCLSDHLLRPLRKVLAAAYQFAVPRRAGRLRLRTRMWPGIPPHIFPKLRVGFSNVGAATDLMTST